MKRFAKSYVDERHRWPDDICVHCGRRVGSADITREHVPSRCLLVKPYPEELMTLAACRECNVSFSRDEEYLATLLIAVLAGSTDPERQKTRAAARMFERKPGLSARIEEARTATTTLLGETEITFWPEMARVARVVVKNARGHAAYELDRWTAGDPERVEAFPLRSLSEDRYAEFEVGPAGIVGWPEVGTRMFQRMCMASGSEASDLWGQWVVVQKGTYRYAVEDRGDGLLVRSVLREYLGTEVYWNEDTY